MKVLVDWLNINKSYLALTAMLALQIAAANHWLLVPADVLNTLSGFAAGAGVGLIHHSNQAAVRQVENRIAKLADPK